MALDLPLILAATGHRPDKLGGYEPWAQRQVHEFARFLLSQWQPSRVVVGMALGWDTAVALGALDLGLPLIACVPFAGQELRWPLESQRIYGRILEQAAAVELVCSGGYAAHKMQLRNRAMVDQCDLLLACWDGSPGGTANCVEYARLAKCPTFNCYPDLTASSGPV